MTGAPGNNTGAPADNYDTRGEQVTEPSPAGKRWLWLWLGPDFEVYAQDSRGERFWRLDHSTRVSELPDGSEPLVVLNKTVKWSAWWENGKNDGSPSEKTSEKTCLPAGGDMPPPETPPQVDDVKHDEKG
jgi:hypothetical protein